MDDATLQEISDSIRYGDKKRAQELLKPILKENPSAEAWYLASQAANTDAQMVKFLQKAVELDPSHEKASRALEAMQAMGISSEEAPEPEATIPLSDQQPPEIKQIGDDAPPIKPTSTVVEKKGDTTVYDDGVYEMLWDCKFCGTEKLLGKTHRFCPNCGSAQDPEWRYFPSEDEKIAVRDHKFVGADKTCPACGTLNAGDAEYCIRCGAPQTEAARVKQLQTRTGNQLGTQNLSDLQRQRFEKSVGKEPKKKSGGLPVWAYFLILLIIGGIGFGAFAVFSTQEVQAYVSDFHWERTIEIEKKVPISGKSDCGREPAGAYSIDRRYEQVGTKRVADGETCTNRQVDQGDGTFRQQRVCETNYRNEPVMGYVCYYTVDQWRFDREVKAEGNKDVQVVWPEVNLSRTGDCRGCEREGTREANYYLVLTADGGVEHECEVDVSMWQDSNLERTFSLQISTVGGGARCDTLIPSS